MFVSSFDLAKARREQRLGKGEADIIESAVKADLLLLDELCAERSVDTALDEVIRARWDNCLPTIYTCGFPRTQILEYGAGVERRVTEGATVIVLKGGQ